jgi:hypothetical protein
MPRFVLGALLLGAVTLTAAEPTAPSATPPASTSPAPAPALRYESRMLRGWSVLIRVELLTDEKRAETERGLVLIGKQLEDIERT